MKNIAKIVEHIEQKLLLRKQLQDLDEWQKNGSKMPKSSYEKINKALMELAVRAKNGEEIPEGAYKHINQAMTGIYEKYKNGEKPSKLSHENIAGTGGSQECREEAGKDAIHNP